MQITKQAIFMLGEEEYGFDIMDVNTLEKIIPIDPVEGFSHNLKGTIQLRGDIIPVCSLRRKFGLEDIPSDSDTRFIVTTSNGIQVAYEVDRMKEIIPVEDDQVFETPFILKTKDTSYIKAVTKVDNRIILVLDYDGILSEEEQNEIKAVMNQ
jgi:Chemotaxis signal transduction protein